MNSKRFFIMEYLAVWIGYIFLAFILLAIPMNEMGLYFAGLPIIPLSMLLMLGITQDALFGKPARKGVVWVFLAVSIVLVELRANTYWIISALSKLPVSDYLFCFLEGLMDCSTLLFIMIALFWVIRHKWNHRPFCLYRRGAWWPALAVTIGAVSNCVTSIFYDKGIFKWLQIVLDTLMSAIIAVVAFNWIARSNPEK